MTPRTLLLGFLLLSVCSLPRLAEPIAGVGDAVFDVAVQWEAAITAVATTQTVVNQIIDLTPLTQFVVAGGYAEDLDLLRQLLTQANDLQQDIAQLDFLIQILFFIPDPKKPFSSHAFAVQHKEMFKVRHQAHLTAIRVQSLVSTVFRTIDHMLMLLNTVAHTLGNLEIAQTLGQGQSKLQQILLEGNLQRTAMERAQSYDSIGRLSSAAGRQRIQETVMIEHPRW